MSSQKTSQELPNEFQESDVHLTDVHNFQMLQLHHPPPRATTVSGGTTKSLEKCMTGGPVKRKSPSLCSFLQELPVSSKRAALSTNPSSFYPSPPSSSGEDPLRRSFSDIPYSSGNLLSNSKNSTHLHSQDSPSAPLFPGVPDQFLCRSLSDPISSDHQPVAQRAPELFSRRNSDQESQSFKRLRKFKERMEEMRQWMEKIMNQDDEVTPCLEISNKISCDTKVQIYNI